MKKIINFSGSMSKKVVASLSIIGMTALMALSVKNCEFNKEIAVGEESAVTYTALSNLDTSIENIETNPNITSTSINSKLDYKERTSTSIDTTKKEEEIKEFSAQAAEKTEKSYYIAK